MPQTKKKKAISRRQPPYPDWNTRYGQLQQFKEQNGNCNVTRRANKELGLWVMHQRIAYKNGNLTEKQIKCMEDIGFSWSRDKDGWNERFEQLKRYKKDHGNCNVPTKYEANPQLARWVHNQRQVYKGQGKGKITEEQIKLLEEIGFKWVLGSGRRPAAEVSDAENSSSGGEEEAGGATSAGDTQIMIPSLPPSPEVPEDVIDTQTRSLRQLPPIVWQARSLASAGDEDEEHDDNGSSFGVDKEYGESMLTDEYQGHNQQGAIGEVEFANDSSFHMDEEDDHQEDGEEEDGNSQLGGNVSPATEQEGGRSSSVESQQDFRQKLDEANVRIASLLQPDIVDLTNEDSTICEDNQKETAGTKSVEAAVHAVCKIKKEKLDEADKKIAAAEKRAESAERRALVAEFEKEDAKQDAEQLKSLAEEALQECDSCNDAVQHAEMIAEEALQGCDNALRRAACRMCNTVEHDQISFSCGCIMCSQCVEENIAIHVRPLCPYGCGQRVTNLRRLNRWG